MMCWKQAQANPSMKHNQAKSFTTKESVMSSHKEDAIKQNITTITQLF